MQILFAPTLDVFTAALEHLLPFAYKGQLPTLVREEEARPQMPLYTTAGVMDAFKTDTALLTRLEEGANASGFLWKLEWRSEPAALLRSMGINFGDDVPQNDRLFRPQPILGRVTATH